MEQITEQGNFDTSPEFFPITPNKLIIMSICTLGIYEIYWFYRNWKYLKIKKQLKISPFWRSIFSIIFCYSLFKHINNYAKEKGIEEHISQGSLAFAYIIITLSIRLPDPYWIVSIIAFLPLLSVQKLINQLNHFKLQIVINNKYSGWNIFGIISGIIIWGLIILGILMPENA